MSGFTSFFQESQLRISYSRICLKRQITKQQALRLGTHFKKMSTKHICLLREKSPNPLKEILANFKAEYSAKITKGKTKMIENRKRNIQVKFRVDEKEYECILKKVQLSGKRNMASYLRYMAITGRIMNIELEDLKITSANVGRITSSLNQIAK